VNGNTGNRAALGRPNRETDCFLGEWGGLTFKRETKRGEKGRLLFLEKEWHERRARVLTTHKKEKRGTDELDSMEGEGRRGFGGETGIKKENFFR